MSRQRPLFALLRSLHTVTLVALLASAVAWSFFGRADQIVTASGAITAESQQNRVYVPVKGELARYAALCVEQGLVPIVEPEVMMDGAHTIETCFDVTARALQRVFAALFAQRVPLEQILLKPNMVLSGSGCPRQAGVDEVAEQTLRCFLEHVPAALQGIVFLSGGQSDELATAHLNAMNKIGGVPWQLSFSYGRALQAPALKAWAGKAGNYDAAQMALQHRASLNGAARSGSYTEEMETEALA